MRSLTILAIPIYQTLGKKYLNLTERAEATKQYIINEITQWTIKSLNQDENYFFKPNQFQGSSKSTPFEVRLLKSKALEGYHELKFGNLNAEEDEEKFKWDDNDPYKLQKALFLKNVLETKVKKLLDSEHIMGILFQPYKGDGLEDDRLSYFYNMYSKLGKDKYDLDKGEFEAEGTYFITPKI